MALQQPQLPTANLIIKQQTLVDQVILIIKRIICNYYICKVKNMDVLCHRVYQLNCMAHRKVFL